MPVERVGTAAERLQRETLMRGDLWGFFWCCCFCLFVLQLLEYTELNFNKGAKNIHWKTNKMKNQSPRDVLRRTINSYAESNYHPHLLPYTKINSKWAQGINLRLKTLKVLEETMGKNCKLQTQARSLCTTHRLPRN